MGIENDARKKEEIKVGGDDDNMMLLPKVTAEDIDPDQGRDDKVDVTALAKLESTPITSGAIPIAIFDAAMAQFDNDSNLALEFFEELAAFEQAPAMITVAQHIDDLLQETKPTNWHACAAHISMAARGVDLHGPESPCAIREVLARTTQGLAKTKQRGDLLEWCREYLAGLSQGDLDPALKQVLDSKVESLS